MFALSFDSQNYYKLATNYDERVKVDLHFYLSLEFSDVLIYMQDKLLIKEHEMQKFKIFVCVNIKFLFKHATGKLFNTLLLKMISEELEICIQVFDSKHVSCYLLNDYTLYCQHHNVKSFWTLYICYSRLLYVILRDPFIIH